MPISESFDTAPNDHRPTSIAGESGFTLIEIMLVLLIIGITVGLAAIALNTNPASTVDREARRLQAVLNEASGEAVSRGVELALAFSIDEAGQHYQLIVLDKRDLRWKLPEEDEASDRVWRPHTLAEGVDMQLTLEGRSLNAQQLEQMARVQAMSGPDSLRPSILLLSSGEMTPFSMKLTHTDTDYSVTLESDGLSGIYLQ